MNKGILILFSALLLVVCACELDPPSADLSTIDKLLAEDGGIVVATNGNYALFKDVLGFRGAGPNLNNDYTRHLYQMSEFAGDNVMYTQFSSDPLYQVFTREHTPDMENSSYFWFIAYRMILGANLIIDNSQEGVDAATDQIIGENYFLRAVAHFDLLRFFAHPYSHGGSNLGIILRTSIDDSAIKPRATVEESYQQVVSDLLKAESLMTSGQSRGVEFGSKLAAQALLCRVYLYMEQNDKAIEYANTVIGDSRVRLATTTEYLDNFANTPSSKESIFIIKFLTGSTDYRGKNGSIGSMYYDDGNNTGWGEVFVSKKFEDLISQHPEDIRNNMILIPGVTKNSYPIRYVTKFSGQDGVANLCSPQYLRLSEVYLNRAEANAKLGNSTEALADVNLIRERAGLSGTSLYTTANLGALTLLDVVLQERQLELAYEGHRTFDLLRNKRDLVRDFEGIHKQNGDTRVSIPWDDDRGIFLIPTTELTKNPDCKQNP